MKSWELKEHEIQQRENAWYNTLSPFMKLMDKHSHFLIVLALVNIIAFGLGLAIGFLL